MKRHSALPGFGLSMGLTLFWVSAIVIIPLSAVFFRSFSDGLDHFFDAGFSARAMASYRVGFGAAAIAAAVNALFGLLRDEHVLQIRGMLAMLMFAAFNIF